MLFRSINFDIKYEHYDYWAIDELDFIRNNYPNYSIKYLMLMLPNRTKNSIGSQALRMRLVRNKQIVWSDGDILVLNDQVTKGVKNVNLLYSILQFKYTKEEIKRKIKELFPKQEKPKVIKESRVKYWTNEELDILLSNEGNYIDDIYCLLPNRTKRAIKTKLQKLNIEFKNREKLYKPSNKDKNIINYYKSKNIILDDYKILDTYNIKEWYHIMRSGKIHKIPLKLNTEENKILLARYVIEDIIGYKDRDELKLINLKQLGTHGIYLSSYRNCDNLFELIKYIYPEYNIYPWEFAMTGITCFRDEENIITAAGKKAGSEILPDITATYADTAIKMQKFDLLIDINQYMTKEELNEYNPFF